MYLKVQHLLPPIIVFFLSSDAFGLNPLIREASRLHESTAPKSEISSALYISAYLHLVTLKLNFDSDFSNISISNASSFVQNFNVSRKESTLFPYSLDNSNILGISQLVPARCTGIIILGRVPSFLAIINFLDNLIDGGLNEIMLRNNKLVLKGREILCDKLNIEKPCPDDMISCIATIKLPGAAENGIPLHEPDPLHLSLLEKYKIQVPVWYWPNPEGRYLRISAYLYNHESEYEYLADALLELLNKF